MKACSLSAEGHANNCFIISTPEQKCVPFDILFLKNAKKNF